MLKKLFIIALLFPATNIPSVSANWDQPISAIGPISINKSAPRFAFAKRIGGPYMDEGYKVITDSKSNIIIAGYVSGSIDLNNDGDTEDIYETPLFGNSDWLIVKSNQQGRFLWAKRLGGYKNDEANSVAIDANDSIIIAGQVDGDADLNGDGDLDDPNETVAYKHFDSAISVFDKKGKHLWSKRLGGDRYDYAEAVTTDSNGNIIVVGDIQDAGDLNGNGDYADEDESDFYGGHDAFVSVFQPDGMHIWSRRLGGSTYADIAYGVATDHMDNIAITGYVTKTADLNSDGDYGDEYENGNAYGAYDVFVSVFDSQGHFKWAKRLGGYNYDMGKAVTFDDLGNLYITGQVSGTVDLNGDQDNQDDNEIGTDRIFISSFDTEGNFRWNKRLGNSEIIYSYDIKADRYNNVILAGYIKGPSDLNGDGDINDPNENVDKHRDAFITSFNNSGHYQWSKRIGGPYGDQASGLDIDRRGNIILTGSVYREADFNNDGDYDDPYEQNPESEYSDMFIIKYRYKKAFPK